MKKLVNGVVVDMTAEEIAASRVEAEAYDAAQIQAEAEALLEADIRAVLVTTASGNTYQGDPSSQSAMARTITGAINDAETIPWRMSNNTWVSVNRIELQEALRLAGFEQSRLMQLALP